MAPRKANPPSGQLCQPPRSAIAATASSVDRAISRITAVPRQAPGQHATQLRRISRTPPRGQPLQLSPGKKGVANRGAWSESSDEELPGLRASTVAWAASISAHWAAGSAGRATKPQYNPGQDRHAVARRRRRGMVSGVQLKQGSALSSLRENAKINGQQQEGNDVSEHAGQPESSNPSHEQPDAQQIRREPSDSAAALNEPVFSSTRSVDELDSDLVIVPYPGQMLLRPGKFRSRK